MTVLLTILSFFLLNTDSDFAETASKHLGKWKYEVTAPDITYKGIMELKDADGELAGSISSEGVNIPLNEIEIDGNDLSFKMNVQGFACTVNGTFDGDVFKGNVMVEGMSMPMSASKVK